MDSSHVDAEAATDQAVQQTPEPGKGLALAALLLGIAAFMVGTNPFLAIPIGGIAVVLGAVARRKGQRAGFATTGLIFGAFSALYSAGFLFFS